MFVYEVRCLLSQPDSGCFLFKFSGCLLLNCVLCQVPLLCSCVSSAPPRCLICGCVGNFTAVSFPGHFLWAMCLTAMCFCSLTTQTTSKSHILHCLRHSLTQVQYYHVLHSSKQRISVSAFGRACVCCALLCILGTAVGLLRLCRV